MASVLKIIIGSTRPGRVGPTVAEWVKNAAVSHGKFQVELIDLADFKLPLLDEAAHPAMQQYQHDHTKKWSQAVSTADAYIFVTPEYDYFPPASLVNAIQVLFREWNYKVAGVVSYGGVSGGLRSSQMLRSLLSNVNAHGIYHVVPVPFVSKYISDDDNFLPNEQMSEGLILMLNELEKWTDALKVIRS
ncbi:NAD(P)H-dependent oxidoreductase [Rhizobium sp. CG4]|jgi:NAD(P)H-dependent FMN reductase|uniref:NADPH-dependent FMN reductase n=1 Tax=unclassified Rhizobium TaxID=2613769 RepID=UPI00203336C6|nr:MULTISPECIES: NAD(P)H-dependent oxidoreductase [unclassified Rhizobium]MCM2458176.1 NAD(P)H-dependent oxidoreductase [Rhizobium sp. CG4]MCS4243091.1 NAD(P)H-dependent FMN reductase [Rhizobium sp. BIGb0125]